MGFIQISKVKQKMGLWPRVVFGLEKTLLPSVQHRQKTLAFLSDNLRKKKQCRERQKLALGCRGEFAGSHSRNKEYNKLRQEN